MICGEVKTLVNCHLYREDIMIPRIAEIKPEKDYTLDVLFDDGRHVIYDMKDDMNRLPHYDELRDVPGLFELVQMDESRTIVFWNDMIDLPSDTLYEYGKNI